MTSQRKLNSNFVLRKPSVYLVVLTLSFLPYFIVDYQSCYMVAKATNPELSLLHFIRHILIEKFSIGMTMSIVLFGGIYFMHQYMKKSGSLHFEKVISKYLLISAPTVIAAFGVYTIVFWLTLDLFPSSHGPLQNGMASQMMVFNSVHFGSISYMLIGLNILGSLKKPALTHIEVDSAQGKTVIELSSIRGIFKENGWNVIYTNAKAYRTTKSISHFEMILDSKRFIRVNRAGILELSQIENYSYWEHDKYLVRTSILEVPEVVVSRKRMQNIKKQLLSVERSE